MFDEGGALGLSPTNSDHRVGRRLIRSARPVIVVCVLLITAASVWRSGSRRGPASLSESPYLRGVVEPITIVESMSFDDGGSLGVRFRDAKGVDRDVCMLDTLDDRTNVVMGSFWPRHDGTRLIPISGVQERALLGLLDRWAHRDPDGQELLRRTELWEQKKLRTDDFTIGLSDSQREKLHAMNMLRRLRDRN